MAVNKNFRAKNGITIDSLGSASSPAINFFGDENTGIYSPGADQLALSTGSIQRLSVDASGNVGLGVTPSAWSAGAVALQGPSSFSIANSGNGGISIISNAYYNFGWKYVDSLVASYYEQTSGRHCWYTAPSGTAGTAVSFTEAMRLDASSNLSVTGNITGASISATTGSFSGQISSTLANNTATGGGQIYLNGATGNRIDFNINGVGAPAFTTRSAGTKIVLYPQVGASSGDYAFGIEPSAFWSSVPTTTQIFKWYAGTTHIATLTGAGTFATTAFSGSGANLTNLTAGNLSGTIPSAVLGNSSLNIGTTSIALNRASANQGLTGISSIAMPGATSGTITITPTATAGTTAITIPATTGTLITTGDTGTVTSTMIADGTIVNGDISASAAIAVSKLAASTISGVTLGNNLNTLTLNVSGTGLSGSTTYNGSAAATFTVTSNATNLNTASTIVARDASGNFSAGTITATAFSGSGANLTNLTAGNLSGTIPSLVLGNSTLYIGTTAIALNRASASQALTGITSIDGSAALLTTARTLWGQSFNGSANVTGNLTSVGDITGTGAVTITSTSAALNLTATGANNVIINTNANERLRIDSSGNVGIGTGSPSFKADIAGDIRVQSTNRMRFGGTSSTTNFYIQYNSTANSLDFIAG